MTLEDIRSYSLIYLASPYSKYAKGLQAAFEDVSILAARLIARRFNVYSPIAHTHPIAIYGQLNPLDHSLWLPANEAMMNAADALLIAKMEGYKESYGIGEEMIAFSRQDKPHFYIDPVTMEVS